MGKWRHTEVTCLRLHTVGRAEIHPNLDLVVAPELTVCTIAASYCTVSHTHKIFKHSRKLLKKKKVLVTQLCPNSLWPHGLKSTRLLHPWNSPGKNTRVGHLSPFQGSPLILEIEPKSPTLQAESPTYRPPFYRPSGNSCILLNPQSNITGKKGYLGLLLV